VDSEAAQLRLADAQESTNVISTQTATPLDVVSYQMESLSLSSPFISSLTTQSPDRTQAITMEDKSSIAILGAEGHPLMPLDEFSGDLAKGVDNHDDIRTDTPSGLTTLASGTNSHMESTTVAATLPAGDPALIRLTVKDQEGSETHFRIRRRTPLRRLMARFCNSQGLLDSLDGFMLSGEMITPDDTAEQLGLQDGDIIDVIIDPYSDDGIGDQT